ncbi:MAG: hypothetical protein JKY26_17395 [Pseudomonas sp.]|nr:hypothetical protein [Pseudomonas sp.]
MTVLIELPGVLSDTTGLERVVTTINGFPEEGMADLFLFSNSSGTAVTNALPGRDAALIEQVNSGDYASGHTWLSGGGGLELQGTQIVSMPAFKADEPWTLVYAGAITGHLSGATEALAALIAFRDRSTANVRGPVLFARSFQAGGTSGYYQGRAWQGSSEGASVSPAPSSASIVGSRRVSIMSYNGLDTVAIAIYDKNAAVISAATVSATDAGMTTNAGVVKSEVQPSIGVSNGIYDGGIQQVETFARYSRLLTSEDVTRICANAAVLGGSRGRVW